MSRPYVPNILNWPRLSGVVQIQHMECGHIERHIQVEKRDKQGEARTPLPTHCQDCDDRKLQAKLHPDYYPRLDQHHRPAGECAMYALVWN